MASRTALITGVSRPLGIGFAVAQQLVEQGYHVILTARDVSKAEQLAAQLRPGVATALRLDLADPTSVAEAADQVAQTFGHLDVLINNASFFPDHTALSALDADLNAVRSALEIDVIGPWGLILALLPLLKKAPAARIVNVSSVAASQISTAGTATDGLFRAPAHSLAKYTLNVLTTVLAGALADTPILVNAVDPGETATHPERGDEDTARSAAESAKGIIWAATLDENGPSGGFFRDGHPLSRGPSAAPLLTGSSCPSCSAT